MTDQQETLKSVIDLKRKVRKHELFSRAELLHIEKREGFFVMDCPECQAHQMFFDPSITEVFFCNNCGIQGSFDALLEMVIPSLPKNRI